MTDDDGKPMAECEGGCKTWVHLKCYKIKLGDDWFCDNCQQAIQTSKAGSDDLDDPMDEPADAPRASPCNAPSSNAPGEAVHVCEGRAALSSPADGDLANGLSTSPDTSPGTRAVSSSPYTGKKQMKAAASSPDTNKKGGKAAASSPHGSSAAEDIELDLSPAASPAPKSSSKKSKKVRTPLCVIMHHATVSQSLMQWPGDLD